MKGCKSQEWFIFGRVDISWWINNFVWCSCSAPSWADSVQVWLLFSFSCNLKNNLSTKLQNTLLRSQIICRFSCWMIIWDWKKGSCSNQYDWGESFLCPLGTVNREGKHTGNSSECTSVIKSSILIMRDKKQSGMRQGNIEFPFSNSKYYSSTLPLP